MREVMMKTQALAEAIVNSETYQRMHTLEEQVTSDEAAAAAIADYMEKRTAVENILRDPEMDAEKLAQVGQAMAEAEAVMDECPIIRDMRDAQQKFNDMMDNVNRILRLVVTGETEDEGGCSGNCSSCGSCGSCGGCE